MRIVDAGQKKKSIEHLVYEIMMFNSTAFKLLSNIQDPFEVNVMLESFAIHGRNLFDFFYEKRKYADDIIANDFIVNKKFFRENRTKKRVLQNLTNKANKQIAHLTYSRNNYNSSNKGWKVKKIYDDMNITIGVFYQSLGLKEKQWIIEFYKIWGLDAHTMTKVEGK